MCLYSFLTFLYHTLKCQICLLTQFYKRLMRSQSVNSNLFQSLKFLFEPRSLWINAAHPAIQTNESVKNTDIFTFFLIHCLTESTEIHMEKEKLTYITALTHLGVVDTSKHLVITFGTCSILFLSISGVQHIGFLRSCEITAKHKKYTCY